MKTLRKTFSRGRRRAGPYEGAPLANAYFHLVYIVQVARELSDQELLQAALKAGSFRFWNAPSEDVYTLKDGEPV
jgi:hypothetical protein